MKFSRAFRCAVAWCTGVLCLAGKQPEHPWPQAVPNRAPLQANAFNPLPLGAVVPEGWLRKQEQIQAAGLTGHLDEFWNDVGPNSGWLGGTGESWERGPYYLDGLLPLAYQLNDQQLIAKAKRWVEWTLQSQQPDGQFGPQKNDDWWPRMVMLKVLTQYQEVSGDSRVIPFLEKYFVFERRELPRRPLHDWGKYRWQDNVYTVLWLYNRTSDANLIDLVRILHQQGYDWEAQFAHFTYTGKETRDTLGFDKKNPLPEMAMQTHGVNNAMALKVAPEWWLVSGQQSDRKELARQLELLDKYHGLPNGMFSGDEHFAGRDPSQGIELCAVVESMFSYETAFAILGDSALADRLERVAYNALPGTLSNDMWSHQYDQQPNQIACTRAHRQWSTNGDDSNLFGLAPNFGCCTANLHQGWPKLVSSLWMGTTDGGLATVIYAPSQVAVKVPAGEIQIREETAYPFDGEVRLTIWTKHPADFPLLLRVPQWTKESAVQINGQPTANVTPAARAGGFYRLQRNWKSGDQITIKFPMKPRVSHWYRNSAVFERGPLVFSLPLEGTWSELKKYQQKSADWQITSKAAWNFAVELGPCAMQTKKSALGETPFDVKHPAVTLEVKARRVPAWKESENSAGPVPLSPVSTAEPAKSLLLVPYGAAKLRMTAFPFLKERVECGNQTPHTDPMGK